MALPEIIKDIDARVIRPISTDNAIVRFDGTTGQIQNTANTIDDSNNTIINGRITSYVNDPIGNFLIRNDAQKSSERFIDNYGNLVINLADRDQGTTYPFSQLVIGHYNNGSPVLHFGWGKNGSYESVFNILHSGNVSSYAWTGKSNMTWDPSVNILCSGTNAEWSIDCSETSPSTGDSFFHIWSSNLGNSMIQCFPKDGRVVVPYKLAVSGSFIGDEKLSVNGNLYVQGSARISSSLRVDGSITNLAVNGGIYWNPYVESSSDPTDAASITVIRSGVAGGTELRISQANDANDIVNISVPTNDAARVNNNIILHTGNIQSLGFSRIATGSYTGTGTYGKNSPNTLNLGVVPKLVLVMSTTETRFTTGDSAGYANYGIFDPNITQMGAVRGSIHVSFSGTTLSWYVDVHRNYYPETQQLNKSGVVYKWYALY